VFSILKSNLGKRILLLVFVSMLLMLIAFVLSGWLAIDQTLERTQNERQAVASVIGKYLDRIIEQNLVQLENFRLSPDVNLEDNSLEPERIALHNIYLNSIFDNGVFLTDKYGSIILNEPSQPQLIGTNLSYLAPIMQSLTVDRTSISAVVDASKEKETIIIATPIHDQEGHLIGLIGGEIDPAGKTFTEVTHLVEMSDSSYVDIIDSTGKVIISSQQPVSGSLTLLSARQPQITVSSALSYAPWSVVISEDESTALGPLREMEFRLIIFGLFTVIIVFLLSWGMTRSIIKPLANLNDSANKISLGDLSEPISKSSDDEIGQLSNSFDTMRKELKKSLDEVQNWSRDLEIKVQNRTQQLQDSYREIERKDAGRSELLAKLFSAQEEERKRIARELHDETSQSLNGLLMRAEAALALPNESSQQMKDMILNIKNLTIRTVDSVHKIIFDLRPTLLDDLGLLSALRWYVGNRLNEHGIEVRIEVTGEEKKMSPTVETALFRVVQEAISNILRHSEAQHVLFSIEFTEKALNIEIEDDGKGFVVANFAADGNAIQGLGLLGMKERISLLDGTLKIESQPGNGTHVYISVPLA
jgi:signal transduction histidine kinase